MSFIRFEFHFNMNAMNIDVIFHSTFILCSGKEMTDLILWKNYILNNSSIGEKRFVFLVIAIHSK